MKTEEIFININTIAKELIKRYEYPYQILPNIKEYIIELGNTLDDDYIKKKITSGYIKLLT